MIKKCLIWGGLAVIIFTVAFRPHIALDVVRTIGQAIIDVGSWVTP